LRQESPGVSPNRDDSGGRPDIADIAIVGAGAAGLAAGIFAAEARATGSGGVLLLDGAKRIGAKILISGGGRCNVTHQEVRPRDFHGVPHVVRNILAAFPVAATIRWFESLGVALKREETGKLFPVSDKARTVLDALVDRCDQLGVQIRGGHRVRDVTPAGAGGFRIRHAQGELLARRVIMATGGRSLPRTGSDGEGWTIVERLGHHVTATVPALVPQILDEGFFHAELAGISHPAELTTLVEGKAVDRRRGSLLWTHFGVSGPVVMDASRFWSMAQGAGRPVELHCNLWPGLGIEEADRRLLDRSTARPRLSLASLVAQDLPDRLAAALCRHSGVDPALPAGQLSKIGRRALARVLTALVLPVVRDRGWNFAEVTAGGVPLAEINFRTMESRVCPGLYLIGEMLDCDGRIGGFNFQWAWATGLLAGRSAAQSL
jgi:predicted Rossmann fold flavoprotein